jgi:hypothetical protein
MAIVDGMQRNEITRVAAEWHTPDGKKHFKEVLVDQNALELVYDPIREDWQAVEFVAG